MKRFSGIALTTIAGLLTIGSASAQASTLVYTFTEFGGPSGNVEESLTFTPDGSPNGLELTATAFKDLPSLTSGELNQTGSGLGVDGDPAEGRVGREEPIFGADAIEALQFEFPGSQELTLVSVTYADLPILSTNRDVTLSVDGEVVSTDTVPGIGDGTITYSELGNTFIFNSTDAGGLLGDGDNFRIASATFEHAVPEPFTILGTGLALMSMPLMKKAHKKG